MTAHLSRRAVLGSLAGAGAVLLPGQHRVLTAAADAASAPDYETSFETDEPEWLDGPVGYDATTARTGSRSLRYDRAAGDPYRLSTMSFTAEAGTLYEFSCFVKVTDLVQSPDHTGVPRGGRIGLDAYSADGWLDGGYSFDVTADEWVRARVLYDPPAGTVRFAAALYLHADLVSGTAWFDDLTFRAVPRRLLRTELPTPSYRGLLIPGDHDGISLRAHVDAGDPSDYSVRITLGTAAGDVVDQVTHHADTVVDYAYSATDLAVGRYIVLTELITVADGEVAEAEEWGIEKLATVPATYCDRHGRFIRDGEPVFPFGFYTASVSAGALDTFEGTPFDTMLPYGPPNQAALDLAADRGVQVIYPLSAFFYDSPSSYRPDEIVAEDDEVPAIVDRVARYGDHPALLAWYVADEPKQILYERLMAHHAALAEHDPLHPAYLVDAKRSIPTDFMRMLDVGAADSYPLRDDNSDISGPSNKAESYAATLDHRPMWHVAQAYAWGVIDNNGRFPTLLEFRNMTWQFLCHGATGLIYWSLTRLQQQSMIDDISAEEAWDIVITGAEEVQAAIPVLLSIDEPPEADLPVEGWLDALLKSHGGKGYLFTVNHTRDAQSAAFTVPAAVSVTARGEGRSLPIDPDGTFEDDYAPLELHHYDIELATVPALQDQTTGFLNEYGGSGHQGIARAGRQLLTNAERSQRQGDAAAVIGHLEDYRSLIAEQDGRTLNAGQVRTLIRLSRHL